MSIVVAGVDDSAVSNLVIARAAEQAKWREAGLHLVHVVYMPIVATEVPINWDEVAEAQRRAVWQRLEPAIAEAGVTVERVDLDGYPPDLLVAYASQKGASLLVVGTRGRGEIASLILGSTSHRSIHLAGCDVLVVKAPSDTDESTGDDDR
jgi:nucleotide-binding universal stress UspA family protein